MLLHVLNLAGIAVFAASGAVVGVRKRLDLFGVWTVAALTGLGGGVARDLLIGYTPPATFRGWENLTVATVAALLVFLFHPQMASVRRVVMVCDAFGVALFASTGALMAIQAGTSSFAATLIGMTTGLGGSMLRDILVNEVPLLLQDGDMMAIPAMAGSAVTVVLVDKLDLSSDWSLVAGTVLAFVFRMVAWWRGWRVPHAPANAWGETIEVVLRKRK